MHIESLSLKITAKGARVWLNNKSMVRNGFSAGERYDIKYLENHVEITLNPQGKRVVSVGDIIDIQNKQLGLSLTDCERVHVTYSYGVLVIKPHYAESKIKKRKISLFNRLSTGAPIRFGELFGGIGYLSKMICKGFMAAGISSSIAFANDIDRHGADVIYNADNNNIKNTIVVHDDLFDMDKDLVPQLDILVMGYPCVGFSQQQSTKRKMDIEHKAAGMLFVPVLEVIDRANPAIIVIENSDQMLGSDTDYIISTVLERKGYQFSHTILSGTEHGDFEQRKRLAKVFYSENLETLNLSEVPAIRKDVRKFSEALEYISNDDKQWRDLSYLKAKNEESNHGHKFIVSKPDDTKLPVFSASYGKTQADSALIEHPNNPDLHRICTPSEHCNVRRISGELKQYIVSIADGSHHLQKGRTNATKAHQLLGNSISPTPWESLGFHIGKWLIEQNDKPIIGNTKARGFNGILFSA